MIAAGQTLLIHAEAGPGTGWQSIRRAKALGDAWQQLGGNVTLVSCELPKRLELQLKTSGFGVRHLNRSLTEQRDALETRQIAASLQPDWLVTDGPRFVKKFRSRLSDRRWRVASFVDSPMDAGMQTDRDNHTAADLLIADTPNVHPGEPTDNANCLTGPRFHIAPPPRTRGSSTRRVNAKRVLVWPTATKSAADIHRMTTQLIAASNVRMNIHLLVAPHLRDSAGLLALKKSHRANVRLGVRPDRILQSPLSFDLAVTSSLGHARQLMSQAIPVMLLGDAANETVDSNQLRQVLRSRSLRQSMSKIAQPIQCPQSTFRICRHMAINSLNARPVSEKDVEHLWQWTRDPEVRAVSLLKHVTDRKSFANTFRTKPGGSEVHQTMLEDNSGRPIGMHSATRNPGSHSVQLYVLINPAFRNRSFGTALLEKVVAGAFTDPSIQTAILQAKPGHHAAERMAAKAGLKLIPPTIVNHRLANQFAITRQEFFGTAVTQPKIRLLQRSA